MAEVLNGTVEPLEFTCTQDDFVQAQRLHHTLVLKGRRFIITIGSGAVGLGLLLAITVPSPDTNPVEYGLVCAASFVGVIAIMTSFNRFFFLPRAACRQFMQQKEFRGLLKIAVDPPSIGITSKNGFSKIPTDDFIKWAENRKVILLYRADRLFNFIPKRVVSDLFHSSLVAELTRAGVPKAKFSNS